MPDLLILEIILPLLLRSNRITIHPPLSPIKERQPAWEEFYAIYLPWAHVRLLHWIRYALALWKMSVQNSYYAESCMELPIMEIPLAYRQLPAKCISINVIREIRLLMQWQSELSITERR